MNLYIVESPFQLLCAVEARDYFQLKKQKSLLIIKFSKIKKSNLQLKQIAKKFKFQKTLFLPFTFLITLNDLLLMFLILYWKLTKKKFNYLILGEVKNAVVRSSINNLNHKKYFFLDDGISTFSVQDKISKNTDLNKVYYENRYIGTLLVFFSKILSLDFRNFININWFTCFNINKLSNQIIINHSFNSIKKTLITNQDSSNIFYFIGSPISEDGKLSLNDEMECIKKVAKYFFDRKISFVYCVHRRESKRKIDRILNIENCKLRNAKYPLEIDFLISGDNLSHFGSFFSTTLLSLPLIYKTSTCLMFVIEKDLFKSDFRNTYLKILENNKKATYIDLLNEY